MGLLSSLGISHSKSSSETKQPVWARQLGKSLASGFQGMNFQTGLTQPLGVLGNTYQNLFGDNPTNDYMGVRERLSAILGENGLQGGINTAYSQLLPSAQRSIEELNRGTLTKMSGAGHRFSSDTMDLQRRGAQDILLGTQGQALQAALPLMQLQAQTGMNIMDLIASLSEGQMGRQVPLAVGLATGTPSGSSSNSSSISANVGL